MANPVNISNYYESPQTGIAWGVNYDLIPSDADVDVTIDGITYRKLIGRGRELILSIFGPSSPFANLALIFTAEQIKNQPPEALFYIFQPNGPGTTLYLYASDLSLTFAGEINVDLPGDFQLILDSLSVGFKPISTYPEHEQINGQLRVAKLRLDSIDATGLVQTWLTAGSAERNAFTSALGLGSEGIDVNLSLQSVRLGSAILGYEIDCNGSVDLAFASETKVFSLSGSLSWSGWATTVSADIDLGNSSIKRLSLRVQSGTRLQLAEEVSLMAGEWTFTYTSEDVRNGTQRIFDLDAGKFELKLGELSFTVGGQISGSFSSLADINNFSINRASLRLDDLLRIPLGSLELQLGKDSQIELQRDQKGNLTVALHGSVALAEQGQIDSFLSFQVSQEQPIQWNPDGFKFNGRIDLPSIKAGPFVIGDDAHIEFKDNDIITVDPDLKLDERLFALLLRPVAEPLDRILSPITTPVLEFVGKEIPLPREVSGTIPKKEPWSFGSRFWNHAAEKTDQAINQLTSSLTQLLESSPGRSDRWLNGKLEVVDLLDFFLDTTWRLVQKTADAGALSSLETLGLEPDIIKAFAKMPVPRIAASLEMLAAFQEVIDMIQATPLHEGDLVEFDNLTFDFSRSEKTTYSDNAKKARSYISKLFENSSSLASMLDKVGEDLSEFAAEDDVGLKLIEASVKPFIHLPIFSDLMGTFNALLNDRSFALIELGINARLALAFAYNQVVDLTPYIGFPLPLEFGIDSRLNIDVNPSLGLSTRRSVLQKTVQGIGEELDKIQDVENVDTVIQPILEQINKLLFPVDSFDDPDYRADPYGLYLSHPAGQPLLGVNSELRFSAGVDYYNLLGLRFYTGIGADFEVSINSPSASENSPNDSRLFLVDVYDVIQPLLDAATSVETDVSAEAASGLLAGSLSSLNRLIKLFDYRFQAYIPWGIEPKVPIIGWIKDLPYITGKITLPEIIATSGTIAYAGPVQQSLVYFDTRNYRDGLFESNGNLRVEPGSVEPYTETNSAGNFRLDLDPTVCDSNGDGVVDFKDGLVIVSSFVDEDSFHLLDSITGLDLGFPLVTLPGANASILTTLKYMMLIRWTPSSTVHTPEGPKQLTPELINQLMPLFLEVPKEVLDDDFNPYAALQGNLEQQQAGSRALRFFYEQAFLIYAISDLFSELKLDYSSASLWGREDVGLDRHVSDSIPVVSTNAWGYALTQLFGYTSITRTESVALGLNERFDLTNTAHLTQFFKTILASYPTLDLWNRYSDLPGSDLVRLQQSYLKSVRALDEILPSESSERDAMIKAFRQDASVVDTAIDQLYGESLAQLSHGLADLIQTFREQFDTVTNLTTALSTGGVELLIPAIAGIKREAISKIIPQMVKLALDTTTDSDEFQHWIHAELHKPLVIDNSDRQYNYAIRFASEPARVQGHQLALKVQLVHRDQSGPKADALVAAPDYGLTLRYRLGGTARPGLDYAIAADDPLPDQDPSTALLPLLSFAPGATEAELWIDLNPNSCNGLNPLSLQVQLLNADSGFAVEADRSLLDLTLSGQLNTYNITSANAYVAPPGAASDLQTIALGQVGEAEPSYQYGLLPSLSSPTLPHIAAFDPERDRIVVDSASLIEIRRRKLALTWDSEQQAASGAASLLLRDQDLVIVAGVLVDRVSNTPLATVSAPDQGGTGVAWGQVLEGACLQFGSVHRQTITLGGRSYAPGHRLALQLGATTPSLPWLEASTLVLAGATGQPPSPIMHLAGPSHGYAIGYSPQQVVTVTLPSQAPEGPHQLLIQPYSQPDAGIALTLRAREDDPRVVELLLPNGQLWGQLISAEADLLASVTPPPLLFQAVTAAPTAGAIADGAKAEAQLLIVPEGSQLDGADPFGSTTGLSLERSLDGGLTWSTTTARQTRLAAGPVQFRTRQRLDDGSQLLGPVLQLAVDSQGVAVRSEATTASAPWSANAGVPAFDLSLQPMGGNGVPMWAVPLDRLGVDRVAHSRQLAVDLRLLREARLESSITLALVRERDAQLIDPVTGAALGSLAGLGQSPAHGALDALTWFAPRNGHSMDVRLELSLAAGLDLTDHALVPLLRVPGVVSRTYSSGAAFNPDGQQHVLPLGPARFGFEDTFGGGDWDGDDAVVEVLAMGLSLPA